MKVATGDERYECFCTFCGKSSAQSGGLVKGISVNICKSCVIKSVKLLEVEL